MISNEIASVMDNEKKKISVLSFQNNQELKQIISLYL